MNDPLTILVFGLICLPALIFAALKSSWIVDYLFFVVALNRGIRRVLDYNNELFNPYSLISLTPMIVSGLASFVVLAELMDNRQGNSTYAKRVISIYTLAVGIAFVIGVFNVRLGAVFALGDYIAPIGLMGFGVLYCFDHRVVVRWCASAALASVVVAAYGIYQFYTIPPWDAFWVKAVNFEGYLGALKPTEMALFSTMAERGPASTFLAGGFMVLILHKGIWGIARFPMAALVFYAMLLTHTRTSVIQVALAAMLYPLLNRGRGLLPVIVVCVLIAVVGESALSSLPGTETASSRVKTIGNIQDDGSFRGRLVILGVALSRSTSEPQGLGIGSHGLGNRVTSSEVRGIGDSSGYVEALRTLGWAGFAMITVVLLRIWKSSTILLNEDLADESVLVFRAWFVSGMIALFSGNWIFSATFFWVLAGHCLGRLDEAHQQETSEG